MQTDFLIIGGGIAGISAGAELAQQASVTVLEAEDAPGHHATGRSAAVFFRNYGNAAVRGLNQASEDFLHAPEGVSDSSLLSPLGGMVVAEPGDEDLLARTLTEGSGYAHLDVAQARELVPALRPEKIIGAAYEATAQSIDVDRLLQGYLRRLRAAKGQLHCGAPVTGLTHGPRGWTAQTPKGLFTAPVVINAAGGWADQIATLAGIRPLGITPLRRSAALVDLPEGAENWPMFVNLRETWYAKPEAGRLMISPADADPVTASDVWPDDLVLAEGIDRFQQVVDVPVTRLHHSWAGLRSFAPDNTPVVGFDPRATGFFWLAGQGGYGVQTAPAMAWLTAALAQQETPPFRANLIAALAPQRLITA